MLHTCTLTRTTSLSYRGISLSYHAISLSDALLHFPCVILIEQQFSPYIFEGVFMHRIITTIIYLQELLHYNTRTKYLPKALLSNFGVNIEARLYNFPSKNIRARTTVWRVAVNGYETT